MSSGLVEFQLSYGNEHILLSERNNNNHKWKVFVKLFPVNKKKTKLDLFLEVCSNLKPVFRYFFMENFKTSSIWYEKRLNYTRSVATASIVGKYICKKSRK